ncbi:MAG: rRNA maturation RNase YbeY [Candidatus Cloacimonetes bacterium]|jgi:probable rRNA maturation factor|nr:rRNA maturation RNase YbeY [Candidatus Cloacimonadota bacterium]MDD4156713.1 rRNA maturation RNase YbeY [Candidatus Cloacimonadota bacterium]
MNKIDIINQSDITFDRNIFEQIFLWMKQEFVFQDNAECCLKLSSDDEIKNLNNVYRGKNSKTDVLSFPYEIPNIPFKGDIIIDINTADKQKGNKTIQKEVYELFIHGLLHLAGMDHLNKKEQLRMQLYETKYNIKLEEYLKNRG